MQHIFDCGAERRGSWTSAYGLEVNKGDNNDF